MQPNLSTQHRDAGIPASETQITATRPVWIRVPEATRLFGIGRSSLYAAIQDGRIRSRVLKARRDSQRGIRLLSFDSLCELCGGGEGIAK